MTDLYEALRAAMTPDGRVRMTRELLTAMHEEGERRERGESAEAWRERAFAAEGALTVRLAVRREIEEALGMVPGLTDDQALQRGLDAVRALRERAETAERELEGAEREADAQRERRKRAEIERDAAHERAQKAERERDEALTTGGRVLAETIRDLNALQEANVTLARELAEVRERARVATQAVIDAIGSVGPESVEQAVPRLVARWHAANRQRIEALERARWRERERDAALEEVDALTCEVEEHLPEYACDAEGNEANARERVEFAGRDLSDLIAHARACLDPEIVSRDPAHARLAALVERIEGGR